MSDSTDMLSDIRMSNTMYGSKSWFEVLSLDLDDRREGIRELRQLQSLTSPRMREWISLRFLDLHPFSLFLSSMCLACMHSVEASKTSRSIRNCP